MPSFYNPIIGSSTYTSASLVPAVGSPVTAQSVTTGSQILLNNTTYLYTDKASRSQNNVFDGSNTFNGPVIIGNQGITDRYTFLREIRYTNAGSTNTWTPLSSCRYVEIVLVGGGGSGGAKNAAIMSGSGVSQGGGAGGILEYRGVIEILTPGTVYVGQGGIGNTTNGQDGQSTVLTQAWFGGAKASGFGKRGLNLTYNFGSAEDYENGGEPAAFGGSYISRKGEPGSLPVISVYDGSTIHFVAGGKGGSTPYGIGGLGGTLRGEFFEAETGRDAKGYGAGGGGASGLQALGNFAGGNGSDGLCIIREYG